MFYLNKLKQFFWTQLGIMASCSMKFCSSKSSLDSGDGADILETSLGVWSLVMDPGGFLINLN